MSTKAKSKRQPVKTQKADGSSLIIYGSMGAVLLVLVLGIYTFGIDLGFVHLFGNPDVRVLYAGAIVCLVLAYLVDIVYVKSVRSFFKAGDTWQVYLPYINFVSTFTRNGRISSYVGLCIALLIALPAYTPLGRFFPVDYLIFVSGNSIWVILGLMVLYSGLRGYYALKFKRKAEDLFKKHISESYGAGGNFNKVSYIIYFLPIIRSISLLTDLNFFRSVRSDLDSMRRNER